jgi:antitoxin component of RelBE/YafQ-DinJ toxin-antitoxin module
MLFRMRTTLVIDDHVLAEAKRQAINTGLTLSELTTMALRDALRTRDRPIHQAPFSLPTYGSGTRQTTSTQEIAELRDAGR